MSLTLTDTGRERLIEKLRAASTLPIVFSSVTSSVSVSESDASYAMPSAMLSSAVSVNGGWALTGTYNQLSSQEIVDLEPVRVSGIFRRTSGPTVKLTAWLAVHAT